jgi:glycine cleavage system H protein
MVMKELDELVLPDDVRYAEDHEWARKEGVTVTVGLSDFAQDQLGDIVFVELPAPGDRFSKGDEFGTVESVKAVAELYMPIGGEISEVNMTLESSPDLLNKQPYQQGWLIKVKPDDEAAYNDLMDTSAYRDMLKGME